MKLILILIGYAIVAAVAWWWGRKPMYEVIEEWERDKRWLNKLRMDAEEKAKEAQ